MKTKTTIVTLNIFVFWITSAFATASPSDPKWTRIYKIEGHRTDTIVHLSRDEDKASGTYQVVVTVEDPHITNTNKLYDFSGKVEEINGRIFIKDIQFKNGDSAFDNVFWHGPDGIRWIIGEHAAVERRHRPKDALPGDEGLILTFVSDAEMQNAGEGPTFEKILSLVHVGH